jgi:hypothetical protein
MNFSSINAVMDSSQLALRKYWCIGIAHTLSYAIDSDYVAMEAEGAVDWQTIVN